MTYSLWCEEKNIGDSGSMCQILDPEEGYAPIPNETRPRVGCGVRVGSLFARTFHHQDWWQTTPITEILVDEENYMKFRTKNSIYEWKKM